MNSYERLRYSFDNILKELDDICKSIDDLNGVEDKIYKVTDKIAISQTDYQDKKQIETNLSIQKNDNLVNNFNKLVSKSYKNVFVQPEINELDDQFSFKNENDEYEILKQNLKELDNKTDQINEYYKDTNSINFSTIEHFQNTNQENTKKNVFLDKNSLNINISDKVGSVQDLAFSFDKTKYVFPLTTATYSKNSKNNSYNNLKNKHKIIKQHSVDSNYNNYNFNNNKTVNNSNTINNFDSEEKKSLLVKSNLNIKAKRSNLVSLNQQSVSFSSSTTNSCENLNFLLSTDAKFKSEQTSTKNYQQHDNLSDNEISKIESFYNSMGCYVYVSRCIAELYQIKREDEFDAVDVDPVSDYYNYMKNKQHSMEKKSSVNYMYINSGVPVIIFNYGANPKRKKDLRILLVERSTGFCMFEFKFDGLTKFQNYNEMTVFRLTYNNFGNFENTKNFENIKRFSGFSSAISLLTSKMTNSIYSNNKISNNDQVFSYHNEYFEKYFNSKNRHAHKEHLLKFVIKKDCEEFYDVLTNIMKNKKNQHIFLLKDTDYFLNKNYSSQFESIQPDNLDEIRKKEEQIKKYLSDASLSSNFNLSHSSISKNFNKSSVIICHFDFSVPKTEINDIVENSKIVGLNENEKRFHLQPKKTFNNSFDNQDTNSINKKTLSKSNSKPTNLFRRYSNSSSSIISPKNEEDYNIRLDDYSKFDNTYDNSSLNSSILTTNTCNDSISNNRNPIKDILVKLKKFKKSDISYPVNFNHVAHLDKPVPIGKRYKLNY